MKQEKPQGKRDYTWIGIRSTVFGSKKYDPKKSRRNWKQTTRKEYVR